LTADGFQHEAPHRFREAAMEYGASRNGVSRTMTARQKYARSGHAIALAAVVVGAGCGTIAAQDYAGEASLPPLPKTNAWVGTAAASLPSPAQPARPSWRPWSLETKAKWKHDELAPGVSGGYGENTVNDVTASNAEFVQVTGSLTTVQRPLLCRLAHGRTV